MVRSIIFPLQSGLMSPLVLLRGHLVPEGPPRQSMACSTHGAEAFQNTDTTDRY